MFLIRLTIICFIVLTPGFLAKAQSFDHPVYDNFKWGIVRQGQRIELDQSISFLNTFDEQNLAVFQQNGKFGVIRSDGTVLRKADFIEVEQFGNGMFLFRNKDSVYIQTLDDPEFYFYVVNARQIELNWVQYSYKNAHFLINVFSRERIPLRNEASIVYKNTEAIIYVDRGNLTNLANFQGEMIGKSGNFTEYLDYSLFESTGLLAVTDRNGVWILPNAASNMSVNQNYVNYKLNETAYLYNRVTRELILSGPYDRITPYFGNLFKVFNGLKGGLINREGKIVIPLEYNEIQVSGNNFIVYKGSKAGLFSPDKGLLIPCDYSNLIHHQNFILTADERNLKGVYSLKKNASILDCRYQRIKIYKEEIRAYVANKIELLELDSLHNVTTHLYFDNAISLDRHFEANKYEGIDMRLLSQGWFFIDTAISSKDGNIAHTQMWGFRNNEDSVILRPRMAQPKYIENSNYNLIRSGKTDEENVFWKDHGQFSKYKLFDHVSGKYNSKDFVHDISEHDLLYKSYARITSEQGNAILKDDSVIYYAHIDHTNEPYVRVGFFPKNVKPDFELLEKDENLSLLLPSNEVDQIFRVRLNIKHKTYNAVIYPGMEFNYLGNDGNHLFEYNFSFAEPFVKNTAIVHQKSGWGLVNSDTLVIPTQFSAVKRIREYGDTLFLVSRSSPAHIYSDTSLKEISSKFGEFIHANEFYSVFRMNKRYSVYSPDFKQLISGLPNIKILKNGFFIVREKKEYTIYDQQCDMLGTYSEKYSDFFNDDFIIEYKGSRMGLRSFNDELLMPAEFKSIESLSGHIVAANGENTFVYRSDMKLIRKFGMGKLYHDSINQLFAFIKNGKIEVFDQYFAGLSRFKSDEKLIHFFAGKFISHKNQIINPDGTLCTSCPEFSEVEFFNEGYMAVKEADKSWNLYQNYELVYKDTLRTGKYSFLGNNVFACRVGGKYLLFNTADTSRKLMSESLPQSFSDNLISIETEKGAYSVYNDQLNKILEENFLNITPFISGFAGAESKYGWTLIDKSGRRLSYPSYGEIEYVGASIYKIRAASLKGIYDGAGNVLIPVEYERIEFLPDNKVLCLKDGKIRYFDMDTKAFISN